MGFITQVGAPLKQYSLGSQEKQYSTQVVKPFLGKVNSECSVRMLRNSLDRVFLFAKRKK